MNLPEHPTPPGSPIQRPTGLTARLARFEGRDAAAYLDRLTADGDLVLALQLNGFDPLSTEWARFAEALIGYGYDVFRAWIGTGEIHRQLKRAGVHGRGRLGGYLFTDGDELDLAADLMCHAVISFRERELLQGRWRADGGATLKTYFIRHCLYALPDVFDRWRAENGSRDEEALTEELPAGGGSSPTDRVEDRMIADELLAGMPERTRLMFEMRKDHDLNSIAREFNVSIETVKSAFYRARRVRPAEDAS